MRLQNIDVKGSIIPCALGCDRIDNTFMVAKDYILDVVKKIFNRHLNDDEESIVDTFLSMINTGEIDSNEIVFLAAVNINQFFNYFASTIRAKEDET